MTAAAEVEGRLHSLERHRSRTPILIAIDGGSGAGKTTIVEELRRYLPEASCVHSDDFFDAGVEISEWHRMSPAERAARCIDWRRLRCGALHPLSRGRRASWHPFDVSTASGLSADVVTVEPSDIVVVDGIYSSRPELADMMALTVLVDTPADTRRRRHDIREGGDESMWHHIWDAAEDYYLEHVRPPGSFDLVVHG